jgi:hypothetical protein
VVLETTIKRLFGIILINLSFAFPLIAASNSENVQMASQVRVGSTTLPSGSYKVTWTGSGDSAQVTIEKKGVPVVTVPAKILQQKASRDAVSLKNENGQDVIESITMKNGITLVF